MQQKPVGVLAPAAIVTVVWLLVGHGRLHDQVLAATVRQVPVVASMLPVHLPPSSRPARPHRAGRATPSARPASPSAAGRAGIPTNYRALYVQAGQGERWCDGGRCWPAWSVLAGIGKVESDHGRGSGSGIRSGVNAAGCCAGPMQFNVRNGPPSTWASFGRGDVYDPRDAIPAAARKLRAQGARTDLHHALLAYNNAEWYVAQVEAQASAYANQ